MEENRQGDLTKEEQTTQKPNAQVNDQDVEALIQLLDQYNEAGGSRMKINVVEGDGQVTDRQYHHGRCDVGSPWAKGQVFDVLE